MKTYQQPSAVIESVEVFYIPGFEGAYSVSKCGRVWSHERVVERKGRWPMTIKGQWMKVRWGGSKRRAQFVLRKNGETKTIQLHRILAMTFLPDFREDLQVDHIDRNRLNNDLSNLRMVTPSENRLNSKLASCNTSGFRGVNWNTVMNKWLARITHNNSRTHLGYFSSAEEAAKAYDKAAKELHGEFAELNFPDEA